MKSGILVAVVLVAVCAWSGAARGEDALSEALTFHASFDGGVDAEFARGDGTLYAAVSAARDAEARPGLPAGGETRVAAGEGRFGDALQFTDANATRVFFKAEKNLPYAESNWSGTVSFWLRVSPDEDLEPGYTDPMQITPRRTHQGRSSRACRV